MALAFLGPSYRSKNSSLRLHPHGEFISDQIRQTNVHYELLGLIRVWLYVRPRKVVDVGANLGNHSNFFGLKGAECIAFEPSEANFNLLQQNLKNGVAHKVALGSKLGMVEILISHVAMGNTHIRGAIEIDTDHLANSEFVELRTLDSFELADIDLIKIDVEGSELEVLKGAQSLLATSKPCLWLEIHEDSTLQKAKISYTREQIFGWLSSRGYSRARKIDATNFLFFPEKRRRANRLNQTNLG